MNCTPQKQGMPTKHGRFTYAEDCCLKELYAMHGGNWEAISARLPGRTEPQYHHPYAGVLATTVKHGPCSAEEDHRLTE